MTGKIKWYSEDKGFGFIEMEDGEDMFIHTSQIKDDGMIAGDKVEFEIGEGRKGPMAMNVKRTW